MSNDNDGGSGRSSISVSTGTKGRFNTFRRQLSVQEDEDMTADSTLAYLLDHFEEEHDWVNMGNDDN